MQTAKLFPNGQSQAVRLPKEYRFEGDRVYIQRVGEAVVLLPYHEHAWAQLQSRSRSAARRLALVGAEKISQTGMHMLVAFAVTFGVTGSAASGGIAALVEPVCNVLLMPLHDRLWDRLRSAKTQAATVATRDARSATPA